MNAALPVPADFAEHAVREGISALRKRYSQQSATIHRWIQESGVVRAKLTGGRRTREVPADFAEISVGRSNTQLMAHYGCGSEMLYRWRRQSGVKRFDKMIVPDDFAEMWKTRGILQLAAHYGRNHHTIAIWINKLGLYRPRGRTLAQEAIRAVKEAKPKVVKLVSPVSPPCAPSRFIKPDAFRTAPVDRVQRDMSPAGQAADYLRKFGPVYRCDVRGRPLADGFFWRRGNAVLSDAEIIERADWMQERAA